MRRRLLTPVAFAQAPPASSGPFAIASIRGWRLREPDSGRRYSVVRLTSQTGVSGYGEGGPITSAEFAETRKSLTGRRATSLEFVRHHFAGTPALEAAVGNALLDLSARVASVPLYQFLGGPVRFKTRIMARIDDPKQARAAQDKGYRAFTLTVPPRDSMTRLQAYVDSVRRSLDEFKKTAGDDAEVVLDGAGALLPGDAAVVARAMEREHPIWFDEPSAELSRDALSRFVDETTLPIGLGRSIHNTREFQNLLCLGCVDVLRPSLALNSLHMIRRMAAIAESHYIAVAPYHNGGPLATMLGIHLGGSLSNFYVQEAPFPASARDRAMRAAVLGGAAETGQDGFAPLVNQPGLGVRVDEEAASKYAEETL